MFWVRSRDLICAAVSKPSMPGICTSSRISAMSSRSRCLSASEPEFARISSCPRPDRMASSASRFSGRSSTSRIDTPEAGEGCTVTPPHRSRARMLVVGGTDQPGPHHGQQLVQVDRLGDVVTRPGHQALVPVARHRLRGEEQDRQVGEPGLLPDLRRGLVAVHLRHHHVHQHQVDLRTRAAPATRCRPGRCRRRAPTCRASPARWSARRRCARRRRRSARWNRAAGRPLPSSIGARTARESIGTLGNRIGVTGDSVVVSAISNGNSAGT